MWDNYVRICDERGLGLDDLSGGEGDEEEEDEYGDGEDDEYQDDD